LCGNGIPARRSIAARTQKERERLKPITIKTTINAMSKAKSEYAKALEDLLQCWRCGGDGDDHGQRCHVCNGMGGPNVSELDGNTINEAIEKIREEIAT
jgi:DnaJ-class molecular chaperone